MIDGVGAAGEGSGPRWLRHSALKLQHEPKPQIKKKTVLTSNQAPSCS
jgi:hypothetical protein